MSSVWWSQFRANKTDPITLSKAFAITNLQEQIPLVSLPINVEIPMRFRNDHQFCAFDLIVVDFGAKD
jgi:hypothetical protein